MSNKKAQVKLILNGKKEIAHLRMEMIQQVVIMFFINFTSGKNMLISVIMEATKVKTENLCTVYT